MFVIMNMAWNFSGKFLNLGVTLGQRAAIVIRLFYEEERQKAKERRSLGGRGGNEEGRANLHTLEMGKDAAEILAKKVGMSRRNLYYLLAVYRNRPDLFELVFDGSYTINKAYTPAHARGNCFQEVILSS